MFIAAVGPRMLDVGARHAAGVATWMVGVRTLASFTVPTVVAAADRADAEFAIYGKLSAYKAMFERRGRPARRTWP